MTKELTVLGHRLAPTLPLIALWIWIVEYALLDALYVHLCE